ncbi:MAG: bifunctional demethylmenaquinone methyltransferase/2-methoxy-6-polyprenyl-1,4-benzoquinol methylase UbiE [Rikenellaceae bacterium]
MKLDKDKEVISDMFDSIAPSYDALNHILSLGIDKLWRKKVAKMIRKSGAHTILDVATGTGDLAITIAKKAPLTTITGVDFSKGMLAVGVEKVKKADMSKQINLEYGDALNLEFKDNNFDSTTIGFGVRNFSNLRAGTAEMCRVTRKGGALYVIELSMPQNGFIRWSYNIYFKRILPFIGRFRSKSDFAYNYLPESVSQFLAAEEYSTLLKEVGFDSVKVYPLTFGVATLYVAKK